MKKSFLQFLTEKVDSSPKESMDNTIFIDAVDGKPALRDSVLKSIVKSVQKIDDLIPIEGAYLIGDILKNIYTEDSHIKIAVLIDKDDIDDFIHDRLVSTCNSVNGTLIADTRHKLDMEIRLVDGVFGVKKWIASQPAVFSINKNKFIKKPVSEKDDIKLALKAMKEHEPKDLVFFTIVNPITKQFLDTYDAKSLENIKTMVRARMFDLTREANGIATNADEKKAVKDILDKHSIDSEKLQLKFVENKISEPVAMNLLKQAYYYDILDVISAVKSDETLESEFNASLSDTIEKQKFMESQKKHPSFNEFILLENNKRIKKLRSIAKLVEPGKGHAESSKNKEKGHENMALKIRDMKRKKLRQLAMYRELTRGPVKEISDEFSCRQIIKRAKDVSRGYWPLNNMQAQWIAITYHFDMPTTSDRLKRLSNMPMALFKPKRGGYFLVKDERLRGIS